MPQSKKLTENEVIFGYLLSVKKDAKAVSLKAELIGSSATVTVLRYGADGHESSCDTTEELFAALRSHRERYPLVDGGPWYTLRAEITGYGHKLLTNASERISASWEDMLIDFAEFPDSLKVAPDWLKEAWAKEGNIDG